ncbi:hypothetical protein [Clostridium sporogenes]|nr:hypothetical protein [Clostridium sporogenes]MDS1006445.1 hypothetical protein [Clostridium sporogenes]
MKNTRLRQIEKQMDGFSEKEIIFIEFLADDIVKAKEVEEK